MSFFRTAKKNWTRVYDDDKLRKVLYAGWENWLEEGRKKCESGMELIKIFLQ
jgi:hypothetical protein